MAKVTTASTTTNSTSVRPDHPGYLIDSSSSTITIGIVVVADVIFGGGRHDGSFRRLISFYYIHACSRCPCCSSDGGDCCGLSYLPSYRKFEETSYPFP
jgi:hypothetical protein